MDLLLSVAVEQRQFRRLLSAATHAQVLQQHGLQQIYIYMYMYIYIYIYR